jgi:hypothetical protein
MRTTTVPDEQKPTTSPKETVKEPEKPAVPLVGYVLCVVSVTFAIVAVILSRRVDETAAALLGIAILAVVADKVTKVEMFGVKFEKAVEEAARKVEQKVEKAMRTEIDEGVRQSQLTVKEVQEAVTEIEKNLGPGSKRQLQKPERRESRTHIAASEDQEGDLWDSDPHKGKFGGSPAANSRLLKAVITPLTGRNSAGCEVRATVESTDSSKPLKGTVTFHLHPTFGWREKVKVKVVRGVATYEFNSWGAFTIGAEADDGKTRLELDLAQVKGGTDKFYEE